MYEDLFRRALNIKDPWTLTNIDFDPGGKRIDIYLDFAPGTKFEFPYATIPNVPLMTLRRKYGGILASPNTKNSCIVEFQWWNVGDVVFIK